MGPGRCLELDVGENTGNLTALVRYDYYSCIGKLLKNCGSTLMKALGGGRITMWGVFLCKIMENCKKNYNEG